MARNDRPEFKPWFCYLLAIWPWVNQLLSVTYFFIYVTGLKSLAQRIVKISLACLETGSHYLAQAGLKP